VYGTITANGQNGIITFASNGGQWGGIRLQTTASSNSVIKYCNISGASQGISVAMNNLWLPNFPTIENNTISSCYDGIYLYNSEGSDAKLLRYNTVTNCTNGIRFEGQRSYQNYVWATDNTLRDNIYGFVIRAASPRVLRNQITCNWYGVSVEDHSWPKFAPTEYLSFGYNKITDNFDANVSATNFVNLWFGQGNEINEGQYGGYNSLASPYDASIWYTRFIGATDLSQVMTNFSYFGEYPVNPSHFYNDATSTIDYSDYLGWDPVGGAAPCHDEPARPQSVPSSLSKTSEFLKSETPSVRPISGFATKGVKRNYPSVLLYLGMHHYMEKNYTSALSTFSNIIDAYPDSLESLFALQWYTRIAMETNKDSLAKFVSAISDRHKADKNRKTYSLYEQTLPILAATYAKNKNREAELSFYDRIIAEFPKSNNAKYALYKKLTYYVNVENDLNKARSIYQTLQS
jgi:parallel beta-helix repeat protein